MQVYEQNELIQDETWVVCAKSGLKVGKFWRESAARTFRVFRDWRVEALLTSLALQNMMLGPFLLFLDSLRLASLSFVRS